MAPKPLSTAARNALLQLYRLGFLWYDAGDADELDAALELLSAKCAIVSQTLKLTEGIGHQRLEITLRGIRMAVTIYEDEKRAIARLKMPPARGKTH